MLGNSHYYHGALRKYVIMFGNMFNDIDVVRYDSAGTAVQSIRVPISYAPKEKWLTKLQSNDDSEVAITLPRLSFEMTNMTYAPDRAKNKLNKLCMPATGSNSQDVQFVGVPYDLNFDLYAMFANNEDAIQVTEQILPFFRPEWTHTVRIVPEINELIDVPTILQGMSIEDTYEGDYQTRRALIHTYNFVVRATIYGPVQNSGIIKRSKINYSIPTGADATPTDNAPGTILTLTPGLLANGSPTSNSAASVPISQIFSSNNYGIVAETENYFDTLDE